MRHVDPASGLEGQLLKPSIFSFLQQGCYFTQKSIRPTSYGTSAPRSPTAERHVCRRDFLSRYYGIMRA